MATVNLGAIKFNWKGAFNNSTAYAVDDVVSSGGSSYVCILASTGNATSNGTYWEQMSSAGTNGTNGTDVGTTITTQGDILYRDGSGLQRLGAGTSGQFLKTQGTGANPVWGSAGGGLVQTVYNTVNTAYGQGGSSYEPQYPIATATITPTSASNKILVFASSMGGVYSVQGSVATDTIFGITRDISGGSSNTLLVESRQQRQETATRVEMMATQNVKDASYNTTSALTYKFVVKGITGGYDSYWNQNSSQGMMMLMEVSV